jgi:hypothetical protein
MAQRTKQRLDDVKLTLQRLQRITSDSSDGGEPVAESSAPMGAISRAALVWGERAASAARPYPNRAPLLIAIGLGGVLAAGAAGYALWWQTTPSEFVEAGKTTAAVAVNQPERRVGIADGQTERPAGIASGEPAKPAEISGGQPDRTAAIPADDTPDKTAPLPAETPARPVIREAPQPGITRATSEAQELIDVGKVASARRVLADVAMQSPEAALLLARSYDPNFLRLVASPDATADAKEAERWYRAWHEIASQKGLVMEMDRLERIIKAMK